MITPPLDTRRGKKLRSLKVNGIHKISVLKDKAIRGDSGEERG